MSSGEMAGREEIIKKYRLHDKDTGSPEVQIALLTKRLDVLTEHVNRHPQDMHSQRGMFQMISKRKSLLNFLKNENIDRYRNTIGALNLRK